MPRWDEIPISSRFSQESFPALAGKRFPHGRVRERILAPVAPAVLSAVLVLVSPLLAQDRPPPRPDQVAGKSCLAAGCHDALAKPKYLHSPVAVEACDRCHQPTDRENHKYKMAADPPGLCLACHVKLEEKLANTTTRPFHHKPVDEGKCLDCHDPHASGHPRMLKKDSIVDLCMSCHQEKLSLAGNVHKPIVEKGCLECHRGHDSDDPKLLRQLRADLCVSCHADKYKEFTAGRSVHKPVAEKNCLGCHTPHASTHGKLLAKAFSPDLYAPFTDASYELCFSCHNKELASEPATTVQTNFRNGDRNLHFVHVNKQSKGRSCRICHQPHGSTLARLIRPKVPFGDWSVTISYLPTETGGYCGAGCHPAKRYDRKVPVDLTKEPIAPKALRDER